MDGWMDGLGEVKSTIELTFQMILSENQRYLGRIKNQNNQSVTSQGLGARNHSLSPTIQPPIRLNVFRNGTGAVNVY